MGVTVTGITIDWQTRVITVLRDYLGTPTQTVPSYIYSLETNDFRLDLKDLEDDADGMPHLDTHTHNTQVELGGVIYARIIEIINGYTITFEDGQYAVNLFGSNNNIGDVINVNQVSIRTNNSAGLIVDPGIAQAIAYGEAIIYDENSTYSGDRYPVGTRAEPVNNIPDLVSLLAFYKRTGVTMISSLTLTQPMTDIFFRCYTADEYFDANGFATVDCSFINLELLGDFNHSKINAVDCTIQDVTHIGGIMDNCNLVGPIHMSEQVPLTIKHSVSVIPGTDSPILNMVDENVSLNLRDYSGGITIENASHSGTTATLELTSGKIHLEPSCTDGLLDCRGVAYLDDRSSGTTVITNALFDPSNITFTGGTSGTCDTDAIVMAVWNELMISYQTDGTFGKAIQDLLLKADNLQHSNNVQTEMLKNKPNNP